MVERSETAIDGLLEATPACFHLQYQLRRLRSYVNIGDIGDVVLR